MRRSSKQMMLENAILKRIDGKAKQATEWLFANDELQVLQEYANIVSIKRLGFNDHGPVHMRKAMLNALIMFGLLADANIKFNLEREGLARRDDCLVAVLTASLLHDIGMTVARENHEHMSVQLGMPFIEELLKLLYPDDLIKHIVLRSLVIEGIIGHMATQRIHTLEAGLVLIGDGCDIEKGRARIPSILMKKPRVGDIHRYSAGSIEKMRIIKGEEKPIRIEVEMAESAGFFQVEEVLYPKIASSPVKPYIELYAGVTGKDMLRYL
ncbi:MAG: phosphohydrolase [Candidatus Cloacimonetes bacterium]|nr:phosphohydrolase [Candidatus Cloacimonadota bacterium]